jgi:hypothetical protein
MLVIHVKDCVYAVPYVTTVQGPFLKTAFPSRQLKAHYFPEDQDP